MTSGATVDRDGSSAEAAPAAPAMRLDLTWCLPRQAATVSMARRLVDTALHLIGVAEDCRADFALAITEACANAVRHAHGSSDYQIVVSAGGDRCVVEVTDRGAGADHERLRAGSECFPQDLIGRGRGLPLIRACMDTVEIGSVLPCGLTIRMIKTLT